MTAGQAHPALAFDCTRNIRLSWKILMSSLIKRQAIRKNQLVVSQPTPFRFKDEASSTPNDWSSFRPVVPMIIKQNYLPVTNCLRPSFRFSISWHSYCDKQDHILCIWHCYTQLIQSRLGGLHSVTLTCCIHIELMNPRILTKSVYSDLDLEPSIASLIV